MQQFGETSGGAAKAELQVRLQLIEEFTPGAGVERGALGERGLHRLGEEMRLEEPYMLDPGTMPGNDRIAFIPGGECRVAYLDKLQFEEGEVLAQHGAQFPLNLGVLGFDRRVG